MPIPGQNMHDEQPSGATSLADRVVLGAIHFSVYLFAIALTGLCGGMLMGLFEHEFRQWGWVAGALAAAIGYPLGWVIFPRVKRRRQTNAEQSVGAPRPPLGRIGGSLVGAFVGLIFGICLWSMIMTFWISLELSPFTPDSWRDGMKFDFKSFEPPLRPGLLIFAWSTGLMMCFGALLGLCKKMHRLRPGEPGDVS